MSKTKTDLSYIPEALRGLAVPLDTLTVLEKDARIHDQRNLDAIRASLAEFGQDQLVVVQRDGMVVRIGRGRVTAARQLGWTHIAALVVDESEVRAIARGIKDNRIGELAGWDNDALAESLRRIMDSDEIDALATGWNQDEIAGLLDDETELRTVTVQPPPAMAWVLIGIPTVRYGEIAEQVEAIARVEDVFCEVVANNG